MNNMNTQNQGKGNQQGQKTGQGCGQGFADSTNARGYGRGMGRGLGNRRCQAPGRGMGYGRRTPPAPTPASVNQDTLQNRMNMLEAELSAIKNQLKTRSE